MSTTSEELMNVAREAADKIELAPHSRTYPSFGDIEEQCEAEFDELLTMLHEDEVFEPVSVDRQEELVQQLQNVLPEERRAMLEELVDNHARHVWLNQEAAFHLGMAIGIRIAQGRTH
jgi:cyclopropane fatty-acyl-phospholipid synthase-like methyltransferase